MLNFSIGRSLCSHFKWARRIHFRITLPFDTFFFGWLDPATHNTNNNNQLRQELTPNEAWFFLINARVIQLTVMCNVRTSRRLKSSICRCLFCSNVASKHALTVLLLTMFGTCFNDEFFLFTVFFSLFRLTLIEMTFLLRSLFHQ